MKILSVDFVILGLVALAVLGLVLSRSSAPCCELPGPGVSVGGEESVAPRAVHLAVEGMPCPSCEVRIRAALKKLHGVRSVTFNREQSVVLYDPAYMTPGKLIGVVGTAGFRSSSGPAGELTASSGGSCLPAARSPGSGV